MQISSIFIVILSIASAAPVAQPNVLLNGASQVARGAAWGGTLGAALFGTIYAVNKHSRHADQKNAEQLESRIVG